MTMIDTAPAAESDAAPRALYRLEGVTRTYRQKDRIVKALAGVDLEIDAGDFVTIQGPTGGGKSTLLQLLGALDRPTYRRGAPRRRSTSPARANAELGRVRAHEIGFVFQGFNLIPTLTAAENVDMALEPLGLPKDGARRRASPRRSRTSASPTAPTTGRASCPAVSSSGSRSRGRSSSAPACCWPTSRPATSTRACATRSSPCSSRCAPRG